MFKRFKIVHRLTFAFLSLGALVLIVVSTVFYFQFKEALIERTLEQLSSVNMLKKKVMEEAVEAKKNKLSYFVQRNDLSGLKTAVARYLEATPTYAKNDVAASFQEAIVDVLLLKAIAAAKKTGINSLVIAGGVAANSRLRQVATERCAAQAITLRIPSPGLCTDNGAMVAALGSLMVSAGRSASPIAFDAASSLPVTQISI